MGCRGLCQHLHRLSSRRHQVSQPLAAVWFEQSFAVTTASTSADCQHLTWAGRGRPEVNSAQDSTSGNSRGISTTQLDQLKSPAMAANKQKHRRPQLEWKLLELHRGGDFREITCSPEQLGLSPRDWGVFAETRPGKTAQRATIMPRSGAILFRTEIVQGVVRSDHLWLFPCRRERDTIRVAQALYAAAVDEHDQHAPSPEDQPQDTPSHTKQPEDDEHLKQDTFHVPDLPAFEAPPALPFELRVLEALLAETVRQFERRRQRLALLADTAEEEITKSLRKAAGDMQRLLPVQRALTEMQHDVRETQEALQECMDNPATLSGICLSEPRSPQPADGEEQQQQPHKLEGSFKGPGGHMWQPTAGMRAAAGLLESYERQILTVHGAIREMQENLEVTRDIWGMQLDAARNRIIRIELMVAVASLALMAVTVPGALFGMNIPHGLEETEGVFWPLVWGSTLISTGLFGIVWMYWRWWPNKLHARRVGDMRAMRRLLSYHIDDLEDVMTALREHMSHGVRKGSDGAVSEHEFSRVVHEAVHSHRADPDEISLLYRMFDSNKDGFLELGELMRAERPRIHKASFNNKQEEREHKQ